MKPYFGYIRVSTIKQGEQGVSLQQQREAIERFAQRNDLAICQWFEEQETAAKQGRPVFNAMIKLLKRGKALGVVIHKIDRSARNLRDWATLGELIDAGIDVLFANESLDLRSRGGRLSADIQAVVAADYIRNLREETRKGFYGRLKQGIYPLPAPLGYLDMGQGKAKAQDPATAPLIRKAFELYSSGRYNFALLCEELEALGLRTKSGRIITKNKLTRILNNPFYTGIIRLKKTNETFAGIHQAIVSKSVFDRVQAILQGKLNTRTLRHDFLFRRRLKCQKCQHTLIGETHKGYVYYRCQTADCPTTAVREEAVESAILERFAGLCYSEDERRYLGRKLREFEAGENEQQEQAVKGIQVRVGQINDRIARLTDAYVDRLIEKDLFEQRKNALLSERKDLEEKQSLWSTGKLRASAELANFLERAKSACSAYKAANPEEKRELVNALTSNRVLDGKTPVITLSLPFNRLAECLDRSLGGPRRDIHRIWCPLFKELVQFFRTGSIVTENPQLRKTA